MSRGLALFFLMLGGASAPAFAQETTTNTAAPPVAVGPGQLKDFSLNGTVTREATPTPAPAPTPAPSPSAPTTSAPARRDVVAAPKVFAPRQTTERVVREAPAASAPFTPVTTAPAPTRQVSTAPLPAPDLTPRDSGSWWPWLLAMAVAAGAVVFLWWRRQQQFAFAGPEHFDLSPPAPVPAPEPVRRAAPEPVRPAPRPVPLPPVTQPAAPQPVPRAAPQPAPALTGGIVSRGLAPKLAFDFKPLWIEVDDEGNAGLIYDLTVKNIGHAPAREVLIEARMFNAGPDQDRQIGAFFQSPQATGDRVPAIAPQAQLQVRSRVALFADRYQPIEMEGRKLLVPLIAFNSLYRGGAGETQSSGSFLIGVEREGQAKMGPLRLDQGARRYDGLGARPHSGGLPA